VLILIICVDIKAKYCNPYSEFVLCIYPIQVHTLGVMIVHTHTHAQVISFWY